MSANLTSSLSLEVYFLDLDDFLADAFPELDGEPESAEDTPDSLSFAE